MSRLRGNVAATLLGLSMTLSACSRNGVGGSERVPSPGKSPIAVKGQGPSRLHGTLLDPRQPASRPEAARYRWAAVLAGGATRA